MSVCEQSDPYNWTPALAVEEEGGNGSKREFNVHICPDNVTDIR